MGIGSRRRRSRVERSNGTATVVVLASLLLLPLLITSCLVRAAFASSSSSSPFIGTGTSVGNNNALRRRLLQRFRPRRKKNRIHFTTAAVSDRDDREASASSSSSSSSSSSEITFNADGTIESNTGEGTSSPFPVEDGSLEGVDSPHSSYLPPTPPPLPTISQFRNFALPCLGLWVAQPLLSLVDTAFVGRSGSPSESARQLAALGPATTFIDGATYLFAFLNVATTNLYSAARARSGDRSDRSESVVRTAAAVSLKCGFGLMLLLLAACEPLLRLYVGDRAATEPGLLDSAVDYVYIRALSMPTSLLLGVVQAACLGAKDSVTPLIAILYSTAVNVVGDYFLVNQLRWGLRGAAIATTAAQWAATAALLRPARRRLTRNRSLGLFQFRSTQKQKQQQQQQEPTSSAAAAVAATTTTSSRSFLAFAAPVLTLILGKLAAFGFMTHSAAAIPGQPTPLAAHQIVLSLLFSCSPFLEVISQTAQTFLPPYLAPVQERVAVQRESGNADYDVRYDPTAHRWLEAAHSVGNRLLLLGLAVAAVVAGVAALVPALAGNLITSDRTVQEAIRPLAKHLWTGAFFWAPVAVSEGILLARRELGFLAAVYLVSTALLPPALLQVKFSGGDVSQVWACFAVFQLFRAACFTFRIWGGHLLERFLPQPPSSSSSSEEKEPVTAAG